MRVYIGPYTTWIGPFQIADWLRYVGVSEDRRFKIGEYLATTWVSNACDWVGSKKKRKVKIRIDRYDVWSMDITLAMIILPMLKQLKQDKQGSAFVDSEDVPPHLHKEGAPINLFEDVDIHFHERWEYVINELIWTFSQLQPECNGESAYFTHEKLLPGATLDAMMAAKMDVDEAGLKEYHARIANGLRLFGKYYQNLWD